MKRKPASGVMLTLLLIGMSSVAFVVTSKAVDQIITHVGDLIIDGNETFTIENCTYIQTGSIYVRDNATLILKNAELFLNQSDCYQYSIHVDDTGKLLAKNINVESNCTFGTYVHGSTVLNVSDATWKYPIYPSGSSRVNIRKSNTGMINPGGESYLAIRSSVIGFLPVGSGSPTVVIYNSHIKSGPGSGVAAKILVQNSTVDSPWLIFDNSAANLTELVTGFYRYWNVHTNETIFESYNITLVDTQVNGAWGIETVDNSDILVTNSEIEIEASFGHSTLRIVNSLLKAIHTWEFDGNLTFENTTMNPFAYLSLYGSDFLIQGSITFEPGTRITRWEGVAVTRNYQVVCQQNDGSRMPNVTLSLYDKYHRLVWSGVSDRHGKSNFNLTFTDSNYTDTLRLEAVKGALSSAKNVTFLSDTPITMILTNPKTLLGVGWGWTRIAPEEYIRGQAELYKIGETEIELVITCEGELYSRTWKIILYREYKYGEMYICYSHEWGSVIVGFHKHRWQFWWAIGRDVAAFGFLKFGRLMPTLI